MISVIRSDVNFESKHLRMRANEHGIRMRIYDTDVSVSNDKVEQRIRIICYGVMAVMFDA